MGNLISIHEIAARDIRVGDQLSENGARGLDHWYDTDDAGTEYTVTDVKSGDDVDYGETVLITLDNGDVIDTQPDIRVTVIRPRGA
jgi:hypothetical protein